MLASAACSVFVDIADQHKHMIQNVMMGHLKCNFYGLVSYMGLNTATLLKQIIETSFISRFNAASGLNVIILSPCQDHSNQISYIIWFTVCFIFKSPSYTMLPCRFWHKSMKNGKYIWPMTVSTNAWGRKCQWLGSLFCNFKKVKSPRFTWQVIHFYKHF